MEVYEVVVLSDGHGTKYEQRHDYQHAEDAEQLVEKGECLFATYAYGCNKYSVMTTY